MSKDKEETVTYHVLEPGATESKKVVRLKSDVEREEREWKEKKTLRRAGLRIPLIRKAFGYSLKRAAAILDITEKKLENIEKLNKSDYDEGTLPTRKLLKNIEEYWGIPEEVITDGYTHNGRYGYKGYRSDEYGYPNYYHWEAFDYVTSRMFGYDEKDPFKLSWRPENVFTAKLMRDFVQDTRLELKLKNNSITLENKKFLKTGYFWGPQTYIIDLRSIMDGLNSRSKTNGWDCLERFVEIRKFLLGLKNEDKIISADGSKYYTDLSISKSVMRARFKKRKKDLKRRKHNLIKDMHQKIFELRNRIKLQILDSDNYWREWHYVSMLEIEQFNYKIQDKIIAMLDGGFAVRQDNGVYLPIPHFYKTLNIMGLYEVLPESFSWRREEQAIVHNYNHFKKGNSTPPISGHYGAITATNPKKAYSWVIDMLDKELESNYDKHKREMKRLSSPPDPE
jgi:hypothetical protein